MKRLLAGLLMSATLVSTVSTDATVAYAKGAKQTADTSLEELGVIDAPGEEDTTNDIEAIAPESKNHLYSTADGTFVVAIDAGHGGSDAGATYGGIKEKDVNLKIAQYMQAYFEDYVDVEVYLTRSDDTYLSLDQRVTQAKENGADVFVSVHNNASGNAETSGSMVFYPNDSYLPDLSIEGEYLASNILEQLTLLGLPDLGVRTRNSETGNTYDDGSIADYYGVIRNAKLAGMTGIIVEHAFLSNESDRLNYLSTDDQLRKLALADVKGIAESYDLTYNGLVTPELTIRARSYKELELEWDEQESAKGYIVYRSDKKNGKYTRLAKVIGGEYTTYIDNKIELGKKYYYKIRAYGRAAGASYYSEYSRIVRGYTIGGTSMTEVRQMTGGYLKLRWTPMDGAHGYAIYRSEEGGKYTRIATVTDPAKGAYNDKTAEPGVNYSYKVRTILNMYGNEGFGKTSAAIPVTMLKDPDIQRLDIRDDGYIKVVWTKALGASSYIVQRSTSEDGEYKTIATITDAKKNYYLDKSAERGMTYYYRVNAVNKQEKVSGSTGYAEIMGEQNFQIPDLIKVRVTKTKPGMYIIWSTVAGAEGYRIYRSTREDGGYKSVATVRGGDVTNYIDESPTEAGTTYYYKVKAFVHNSSGTSWSVASDARSAVAGYAIMGESNTTVEKMMAFFEDRGGVYPEEIYEEYGAPTLEDFCQIVYDEAEAEGVRAEVVFGQICKETGFLRFGGDVEPEQCNFAGIGATGGVPGASFPDVETGIRAQVQHLKAYASDEPLNQECVDPRFSYVKRCAALYVEWLGVHENPTGAGWATGKNYGYSLRDDYIRPLLSY